MAEYSARDFIRAIPTEARTSSTSRSCMYFFRDLFFFGLTAFAIVSLDNIFFGFLLSLLLGTVLTGVFIIGHDCGHRSFSQNTKLNDAVGEFATGLALWPYHVWRLSHDIHHRYTHNIEKDIAWLPMPLKKFETLGPIARRVYYYSRTSLFFIASIFFTFYFIKDGLRGRGSKHFSQSQMPLINRSLGVTLLIAVCYIGISFSVAGWYGFFFLFLIPQLVFHIHLSTFTLFHHTHPDNRFHADEEWNFQVGQLGNTWHISYPFFTEFLTHDINWHVPHHVCVGVPHYQLRAAHKALKESFPELVREETFNLSLVRSVVDHCHFIGDRKIGGLDWRQKKRLTAQTADANA